MNEVSTVTEGGVTVTSTSETPAQISAILTPDEKPSSDLSEAASTLGKEGAQASAEARAAKAKEKAAGAEETAPEGTTDAKTGKGEETDDGADIRNPKIKARIEAKAREAADYRQQRDEARAEKQRLADEIAALKAGKPSEAAAEVKADAKLPGIHPGDPRPKSEDFENYPEYEDAVADWHDRRKERVSSQRRASEEHGKALGTTVDKFLERVAGVPKTDPEMVAKFAAFAQTLSPEVQNLRGSFQRQQDAQGRYTQPLDQTHIMADEIIRSERARDLMQHLSEHPDVFQRIAALESAPAIVREMAKVEAKLEKLDGATAGTRVKPQSAARPPLRPVDGTPHTVAGEPAADAPYEQHKAYWTRRDRERQAER